MATRFCAILLVALLALGGLFHGVCAAAPGKNARIKELFQLGWKSSFSALKPAEEFYEELQSDGGSDPQLAYALALIQVKHRRYERAKELLSEALAAAPDDLNVRHGLIWTLMVTKKHEAALVAMQEQLEKFPESDDTSKHDPVLEEAEFLGRMFGYLEGPGAAASSVPDDDILAQRERTAESLSTARRAAFEAGRTSVLEKFDELSLSKEDIQAKAKEEEEKTKDRTEQRLEAEKEVVEAEKASVDQQAKEAEEKANRQISDLNKQLAAANAKLARVTAAAQAVQASLNAVAADIDRASFTANNSKDPLQRNRALNEVARLRPIAGQYEMQYAGLDAEARILNGQIAQIEEASARVRSEYEAVMQRLGRTANKLRKTEKRIGQDEKKLEKPAKGNTAEARAKAAQASAFTTYEAFPLEKEKQRLLDAGK